MNDVNPTYNVLRKLVDQASIQQEVPSIFVPKVYDTWQEKYAWMETQIKHKAHSSTIKQGENSPAKAL